jgi:hypothetical protein
MKKREDFLFPRSEQLHASRKVWSPVVVTIITEAREEEFPSRLSHPFHDILPLTCFVTGSFSWSWCRSASLPWSPPSFGKMLLCCVPRTLKSLKKKTLTDLLQSTAKTGQGDCLFGRKITRMISVTDPEPELPDSVSFCHNRNLNCDLVLGSGSGSGNKKI